MQNVFLLAAVFGVATAQQGQHGRGGGHCQFTDLLSAKNDARDGTTMGALCNNFQGTECTAACAERFLPFYRGCESLAGVSSLESFEQSCRGAVSTLNHYGNDRDNHDDCSTTATLPVVLQCAQWTQQALNDGQINADDRFCSSDCYEAVTALQSKCGGQMSRTIETSMAALETMVGRCAAALTPAQPAASTACDLSAITTGCGPAAAAVADSTICSDSCNRVVRDCWATSPSLPCVGNPFLMAAPSRLSGARAGPALRRQSSVPAIHCAARALPRPSREQGLRFLARYIPLLHLEVLLPRRGHLQRPPRQLLCRVRQHLHAVLLALRADRLRRRRRRPRPAAVDGTLQPDVCSRRRPRTRNGRSWLWPAGQHRHLRRWCRTA